MKEIKQLARPKTGRRTYSHSIALTKEQIEWLESFPNASEMVRKLIDSIRELHNDIEPHLSLLAMKHEIDILNQHLNKVDTERETFLSENFMQEWDKETKSTKYVPLKIHYSRLLDERVYDPVTPEEAAFIRKQLEAYDKAITGLRARLIGLKDKFMKEG